MLIRNSYDRFGLITKLLHWVIAFMIIGLIWLGWYMVDLTYYDKWYNSSLSWHKSLGMLVLELGVVKIGWQLYSPTPDAAGDLKPWEHRSANIMHKLLLVLMLAIPISGYLISTSDGKAVDIFNWMSIPAIFKISTTIRNWAIECHYYLAYGTGFLLIGHIGAALKHQFINKDGTLKRMLWG